MDSWGWIAPSKPNRWRQTPLSCYHLPELSTDFYTFKEPILYTFLLLIPKLRWNSLTWFVIQKNFIGLHKTAYLAQSQRVQQTPLRRFCHLPERGISEVSVVFVTSPASHWFPELSVLAHNFWQVEQAKEYFSCFGIHWQTGDTRQC